LPPSGRELKLLGQEGRKNVARPRRDDGHLTRLSRLSVRLANTNGPVLPWEMSTLYFSFWPFASL
jgi:hypothetical protein